jgi:membrane fusion protein, multidrug efflux system
MNTQTTTKDPSIAQSPTAEFAAIAEPRRSRKKFFLLSLAALLSVCFVIAGLLWWQYATTHEDTDDAYIDGDMTSISGRRPGTVTELDVTDNQTVKTGQLLLKLDPRDYANAVDQARADYDLAVRQYGEAQSSVQQTASSADAQILQSSGDVGNASAGVASAKASIAEAQANIQQAQSQLTEKVANREQAQLDYKRYQVLDKAGAVTGQQYDQAHTNLTVAQAQETATQTMLGQSKERLAQAHAAYNRAVAGVTKSKGNVQAAVAATKQIAVNTQHVKVTQASVEKAKAALDMALLNLSYTKIYAPIDGKVGKRAVEVGQRVEAGQPLLAVVQNNKWVTANFKETQLGHMTPGQPVQIAVDTFGGHKFNGHIDSLSPASGARFAVLPPDNATGNFTKIVQRVPVKIALDITPEELAKYPISQGMSCEVTVKVAK